MEEKIFWVGMGSKQGLGLQFHIMSCDGLLLACDVPSKRQVLIFQTEHKKCNKA
jgi:hypothetical protein